MIRIALTALVSVILIQITKPYKSEFGLLIKLCSITVIAFMIINEFSPVKDSLSVLTEQNTEVVSFLPILIKTLSIALITEFASSICKDCGENAVQTVVELSGRISILIVCLPIFETLYKLTTGLLEV